MKTLLITSFVAASAMCAAPAFAADARLANTIDQEQAVATQLATVVEQTGADARLATVEAPLQVVQHRHHRSHYRGHHGHHRGHYDYHPGHYHRHGNHYDYHPGHYDYHRGHHGHHYRSYRPSFYYGGRGISIGFGW